ncbi:MAG: restriction endonuclease [Anaerolineales bacterium]|jgi:hypothetical protein
MTGFDVFLNILNFLLQPWFGWLLLIPVAVQAALPLMGWYRTGARQDPLAYRARGDLSHRERPLYQALMAPAAELIVLWTLLVGVRLYSSALWPRGNLSLTLSFGDALLSALTLGALVSLTLLWGREEGLLRYGESPSPFEQDLEGLSPEAFKVFVAVLFRMRGYQAAVGGRAAESGLDLLLENPAGCQEVAVCLPRPVREVDRDPLLQLHAAMLRNEKAVRGYVITTGTFSHTAEKWARTRAIRLIGAKELRQAVRATPREELPSPVPALVTVIA